MCREWCPLIQKEDGKNEFKIIIDICYLEKEKQPWSQLQNDYFKVQSVAFASFEEPMTES